MKKILLILCAVALSGRGFAQFDRWFTGATLRVDVCHAGDAKTEYYFFGEAIAEPYWAGTRTHLIDSMQYGNQMLRVYDAASGELIYSRGFCTLFAEWQTIPGPAGATKAYPESVVLPMPKAPVRIEILSRDRRNVFQKKFEHTVDPNHYSVRRPAYTLPVLEVMYNGNYAHCIDIVLIPEGYTAGQQAKFRADCQRFVDEMFAISPYKENRMRFNVRAVWAPSADEGVTIPGEGVWKNTAARAQFYTFGMERYQMIDDFQNLRDLAGNAPYDYMYIISNTQKYGGGGIYNFYGISVADNAAHTGRIYAHEFGHVLLGLGDEYGGAGSTYDGMYRPGVEPWEENLTTLTDFKRKEWSRMLPAGTPVPTPSDPSDPGKLGVFEGGGYTDHGGVYRPRENCIMRNLRTADGFCPVCTRSIQRMIDWLCK